MEEPLPLTAVLELAPKVNKKKLYIIKIYKNTQNINKRRMHILKEGLEVSRTRKENKEVVQGGSQDMVITLTLRVSILTFLYSEHWSNFLKYSIFQRETEVYYIL